MQKSPVTVCENLVSNIIFTVIRGTFGVWLLTIDMAIFQRALDTKYDTIVLYCQSPKSQLYGGVKKGTERDQSSHWHTRTEPQAHCRHGATTSPFILRSSKL